MWVSQTYLADVEPSAGCYVYYLFEDYVSFQSTYTEEVRKELASFGARYGADTALFFPQEEALARVASEIRQKFNLIWRDFSGKLPGLFVCSRQLHNFEPGVDEYLFIPLAPRPENAPEQFEKLESILNEVREARMPQPQAQRRKPFIEELWDRVSIEPAFMGVKFKIKSARSS